MVQTIPRLRAGVCFPYFTSIYMVQPSTVPVLYRDKPFIVTIPGEVVPAVMPISQLRNQVQRGQALCPHCTRSERCSWDLNLGSLGPGPQPFFTIPGSLSLHGILGFLFRFHNGYLSLISLTTSLFTPLGLRMNQIKHKDLGPSLRCFKKLQGPPFV